VARLSDGLVGGALALLTWATGCVIVSSPPHDPLAVPVQLFDATVFLIFDDESWSAGGVVDGPSRHTEPLAPASRDAIQARLEEQFFLYGVRFAQGSWDQCGSNQLAISFRSQPSEYYGQTTGPGPLAVVYTATIRRDCCHAFSPAGQYEEWLADVAGHELGHLLGYQHVTDRSDIMSTGWNMGTKGDVRFKPFAQKPLRATHADTCSIRATE